jgi:hypothetical protein
MKKSNNPAHANNSATRMEVLLAEAMKQPGLNEIMQVMQDSEPYTDAAAAYYSLTEQQKYPAFVTSCHPSGRA